MAIQEQNLVRLLLQEQVQLTAYIVAIVRDDDLAEDIFQDVSACAFEKRQSIKDQQHLLGWLRVTAKNMSFKALRERANQPCTIDGDVIDLLESHWDTFDTSVDSSRIQALRECMNHLSPYAQDIVRNRYVNGLTGQKLADSVGRKMKTVYMAMTRVHHALAKCVENKLSDMRGGDIG